MDGSLNKRSPMWAVMEAAGVGQHAHMLDIISHLVCTSPALGWERTGASLMSTGIQSLGLGFSELKKQPKNSKKYQIGCNGPFWSLNVFSFRI